MFHIVSTGYLLRSHQSGLLHFTLKPYFSNAIPTLDLYPFVPWDIQQNCPLLQSGIDQRPQPHVSPQFLRQSDQLPPKKSEKHLRKLKMKQIHCKLSRVQKEATWVWSQLSYSHLDLHFYLSQWAIICRCIYPCLHTSRTPSVTTLIFRLRFYPSARALVEGAVLLHVSGHDWCMRRGPHVPQSHVPMWTYLVTLLLHGMESWDMQPRRPRWNLLRRWTGVRTLLSTTYLTTCLVEVTLTKPKGGPHEKPTKKKEFIGYV